MHGTALASIRPRLVRSLSVALRRVFSGQHHRPRPCILATNFPVLSSPSLWPDYVTDLPKDTSMTRSYPKTEKLTFVATPSLSMIPARGCPSGQLTSSSPSSNRAVRGGRASLRSVMQECVIHMLANLNDDGCPGLLQRENTKSVKGRKND